MTNSGEGSTSSWRGFTVLFLCGVVRGGLLKGFCCREEERLILLVAVPLPADNWLRAESICWGLSPVEGKLSLRRVLGSTLALQMSPDSVTTGTFFRLELTALLGKVSLLASGVPITLGDWEVVGRFTPRIEFIDMSVLLKVLRACAWGLILLWVKSISPTFSVRFFPFWGFFSYAVWESLGGAAVAEGWLFLLRLTLEREFVLLERELRLLVVS